MLFCLIFVAFFVLCCLIFVQFPEMDAAVHGEESPYFSTPSGESIHIQVCNHKKDTLELLGKIFDYVTPDADAQSEDHAVHVLADILHE